MTKLASSELGDRAVALYSAAEEIAVKESTAAIRKLNAWHTLI